MNALAWSSLIAGIWCVGNGVLHDAFVLAQHKTGYDRDLLRMLLDGHVLLTCGAVYFVAWYLIRQAHPIGPWLCVLAAVSMIVYCAMIFPFLKSFVTLAINVALLLMALWAVSR